MSFGSEFLPKMSQNAVGMTMRDTTKGFRQKLEEDIIYPEFYHEYGEFVSMEFTMSQFYLDNVDYERTDQIMCSIDGSLNIALVPHVYR